MNGQGPAPAQDLYVTHLDHVGPYLKIYGQVNHDAAILVSKRIEQLLPTCFAIEPTWSVERQQALLTPGTFCVFKRVNGPAPGDVDYMRTRVVHADLSGDQMRTEIEFLDYGFNRTVDSHALLFPKQPKLLQNIPLLCSKYIVLGICSEWDQAELTLVRSMIVSQTVRLDVEATQICGQKFAGVRWHDYDLAELLVQQKQIGAPMATQVMLDYCKKLWKEVPQSPLMEQNNNSLHSSKTPTEIAREQLASRRSLAARLEAQRSITTPRPLAVPAEPVDITPKQLPLSNVTNVQMPAAGLANTQKPAFVPGNPYQRANYQPAEPAATQPYVPKAQPRSLHNYYNVRLNKPMPNMPLAGPPASLSSPNVNNYVPLSFAPARFVPPQKLTVTQRALQRTIPAFRSTSLTVGLTYDVSVSYVENGPHLFWVQLKSSSYDLDSMMSQIERMRLQSLSQPPEVGAACVARFSEDRHCYRALISAVFDQRYRVVYVDYGNSESLPLDDIYQIPPELLQIKPFAFRFSLAGTKEIEPLDESMKQIFKNSVLYHSFQLTVQPPESVGSMQTCNLTQHGKSTLEFLRQLKNSRQAYTKAENLKNDEPVEIRYIDSTSNFYVQKVSHIAEFETLMDEMFSYYNTNQKVPEQLVLGAPCIVKCDQEWYRAEILRVEESVIVRHVDFGYEQNVKRHLIGHIAEKHLKMPRQAIKCCLKGFENNEMNKDLITDQFEMLAEESNIRRRTFTVRVFRIEPDGLNVVNLMAKNLNVMKKLYKLSMPFEQYLSMEKAMMNTNTTHTESLVSSELDKSNVLNSTSIAESEERQHNKEKMQPVKAYPEPYKPPRSMAKNPDWDKHSSSSTNSKDSKRQSSTRFASKHEPTSVEPSFDAQSTASYASGMNSPRKGNRAQDGRMQTQSPRLQNGKPEGAKTTRFNESPRKHKDAQQQNSSNQRSQNAPQGFAQKPQRQKSTLDGTTSSKRSSGVESDATSTASEPVKPEKYMPLEITYVLHDIKTPVREAADLSWWVSPFQFYVVIKSIAIKYESLLREMRQFYRQKQHQPLQLKVGSSVVVHQRNNHAILRATVIGCNHMMRKYRVFCVDTGSSITVTSEDVWQVEQRFADIPCLAQRCSFPRIVANFDPLYIVDRMDKFVPLTARVECEFLSKEKAHAPSNYHNSNSYTVKVYVNGDSLRETLMKDRLIYEVAPEVRISLLAGQQIRGKFVYIRDMTNFRVQLDYCQNIKFLCTFDDAKFVKSNEDVARRFKSFYDGKSFAFNVKSVCADNIVHLSPVMPLLKEDRRSFICGHPVIMSSFKALVVYTAKPYRVYVQPKDILPIMQDLLDAMYEFYETKGELLQTFETGQICAARSTDNNWYRARITAKDPNASIIEVFYLDYGNTENIKREHLKALDDKFYENSSGLAVEVNLPFGRPNNESKLQSRVKEILEDQEVTVKSIEVRRNHLIGDLILANNRSVTEMIKAEKLILGQDLEYMRKQLEKGKSRVYEYIETVDLTLDDVEEKGRKESGSSKSNSPKKKQQQQNDKEREPKKTKPVEPAAAPSPVSSPVKAPTPVPVEPPPVKRAPTPVSVRPAEPQPKEASEAVPKSQPEPEKATVPEDDPYKDMETAALSHCDNPAHFFVHPIDRLEKLHRLQENLQIVSPSLPPLANVVKGADCISMYSVDKSWYRAKVIDAELMVLLFIDFGNTDCVSDATEVKESMWSHIEPFCMPCALPISPKGTADWVDAANGIFNESYTKTLHYEYLSQGDSQTVSYVNLFIEGVDVAKKLIAEGFAKPLEYVASGCSCYIAHVNSIKDFYIQLERDSKALELIEMYLREEKDLKPLEKFEKGAIVAALFEDDELWYRAQLLKQLPDSRYEVLFIDYGNTSTTSKCLLLSEEIANLPSLSKKCSLQLPSEYVSFSPEAETKFAELTGEGELVFTTQLLKPNQDHVSIHLLLDGVNILDRLLPLCQKKEIKASKEAPTESAFSSKAIVTHVESISEMYLQFTERDALMDSICEKLNDGKEKVMKEKVCVGDLCVAQFATDKEFYRAKVVEVLAEEEYRVHLFDYGNSTIVDKLYELPSELAAIPPVARACSLEPSEEFVKNKTVTLVILDSVLDSCNGIVAVEFVDNSAQPPIVRMKVKNNKGINIRDQLQKLVEAELKVIQKKNENSECVISHGSSPKSFYVQLKKNSAGLDAIVKGLQGLDKEQLLRLEDSEHDLIGICYSQEDAQYYRCAIMSVSGDKKSYEVFLVDYGSTITVSEVWKLPPNIGHIPPLALHCELTEIPEGVADDKLDEAFAALLEQHFGEVYQITTQPNDDESKPLQAQLRINYKDFAQELASTVAGVQKPLEAELHNCIVVQYDDPKSFYVQMESNVAELEKMTDKLLDAEQELLPFTDLKVGALCVAQFPEDEVFYRAEIVKVLGDGKCEVHFIDFGNNAVTQQFRELPEELAKPERFSKHCELEATTIAKCDVAKLQSFIDTRFSETFQLEILATKGTTNVVRLFYQNTNISEKLRLQEEQ